MALKSKLSNAQRDRLLDRVTAKSTPGYKQHIAKSLPPQASARARTAVAKAPQLKATPLAAPGPDDNQPPPAPPPSPYPTLPLPPSVFDRDAPTALNRYLDSLDPNREIPPPENYNEENPFPPNRGVLIRNTETGQYMQVPTREWLVETGGTGYMKGWETVTDDYSLLEEGLPVAGGSQFDLIDPMMYGPNVTPSPLIEQTPINVGPPVPSRPSPWDEDIIMMAPRAPRLRAQQQQQPNERQIALARFFGLIK